MSNEKTIVISGGMDPVHIGHVKMIKAAAELGRVIVVLNSDDYSFFITHFCSNIT